MPPRLRGDLALGRSWTGPVPDGGALREGGLATVALAGVGEGAGLGVLAVFSRSDRPYAAADVAALEELAAQAAASLTVSVLQQEVRELGTIDPLTRFFNARYFASRIDQECQRALRAGVPLSVAIMQLDGLDDLRAEGRSTAAETAIEALARHVAGRLRAMDVGCRLDADELAAILPEVEGLDALRVCERLRASLGDVPELAGAFTLSVGVASFPSHAGRPDGLVDNARSALAWAREHGGDRTFLFHTDTAEILRREEEDRGADDGAVLATVVSLAASVDARHPATRHHSENVGRVAALLAAEAGLGPEHAERVRVAGLLHDVGKIGVSDDVVAAEGPLTEAQAAELSRHPEIGQRMLAGSHLAGLAAWVLHHHERMDGRGHPMGLRGGEIPLESRIIAVADAFDRLVSGGPGRPAVPIGEALDELGRRAGDELDPAVVGHLRALAGRGELGPGPRTTSEETA
ncbi:HD domain-containing phosphohydrolase [Miltoncostaea marina]|uniref:HD domain-containing phosphohydrolase n=1 Tax=Miltoncostaea marina TaxID=2843215 RepID=UPI001C3D4F24|nr:HD domain-containing phosphohydrolase [Miltoncostaea marina]